MIPRSPLSLVASGLLLSRSVAGAGLGLPTVDLGTSVHAATLNVSRRLIGGGDLLRSLIQLLTAL